MTITTGRTQTSAAHARPSQATRPRALPTVPPPATSAVTAQLRPHENSAVEQVPPGAGPAGAGRPVLAGVGLSDHGMPAPAPPPPPHPPPPPPPPPLPP